MTDIALRNANIISGFTTGITAVGMLGVGATTDYRTIIKYLKQPASFLTGVLTQLILVPLVAWGITELFQMEEVTQLAVMIQGCCPGGSTSNMVVYWMGGLVDLSIAMTATTSILALGTMPLWLFIYSKVSAPDKDLVIPFDSLGITLGSLFPPIIIGLLINWKFSKKVSMYVAKGCITFGSIGTLIITVADYTVNKLTWYINWKLVVVSIILPLIGFVFGYFITRIPFFKLSSKVGRTVATEVALQNVLVCSAVIQRSFYDPENMYTLEVMIVYPLLYYITQIAYSLLFILLYKRVKKKVTIEDEHIKEIQEEKTGTFKDNTITTSFSKNEISELHRL